MDFETISVSYDYEKIALIYINRPSKLNALNKKVILEMNHLLGVLKNDEAIRMLIITGTGEKAFVAGADIAEFSNFSKEEGKQLAKEGQDLLFDVVDNFPKPVIAAVNGFALGGGLELAMACHIRIASENAKMGLPEVSLGLIPGYGGTQRLPQLVGKGKAMELILTGKMISAQEALQYGLVNSIVSQEELLNTCIALSNRILQNSPNSLKSAIDAVNSGFQNDTNGFQKEIDIFGECFGTDDFIEGTSAFLSKRKPKF